MNTRNASIRPALPICPLDSSDWLRLTVIVAGCVVRKATCKGKAVSTLARKAYVEEEINIHLLISGVFLTAISNIKFI
jgi:hypothetical protein